LAYAVKQQPFLQFNFYVNRHVLIPRPETEELAKMIIHKKNNGKKILDIGTGSGCIAITLKKYMPKCDIVAVDISKKAIAVARSNSIKTLGKTKDITFLTLDILKQSSDSVLKNNTFDIIVSNPPYVAINDQNLDKYVKRYEPSVALYAGKDGLIFFRKLSIIVESLLKKDGEVYFEFGIGQEEHLPGLFPFLPKYNIISDTDGIKRFYYGKRDGNTNFTCKENIK
jgi:release factor glutamine methyltransferase